MISTLYKYFLTCNKVTTDSRIIEEGDMYFSLKGDRFDGNKFAQKAIEDGASYAIVDNPEFQLDGRYILVRDGLTALQDLASWHRDQLEIPVVAITGSNGKTTTKELIKSVLSQKFNTFATHGNLNNHIGVPLSVLSIKSSHEMAIIEIGANHQKEIEFLCGIAKPDYGYITNIGKAHLEGFGGEEGVLKGKTELFEYLNNNHKKAFIRYEDEKLNPFIKNIQTIVFGEQEGVYFKGNMIAEHPTVKVSFVCEDKEGVCNSNLIGRYNFHNILAALAMGAHFGLSSIDLIRGIESYIPTNNRSQVINRNGMRIILDAYNANPSSMKGALDNFVSTQGQNKWVILGDMLELGDYSTQEHQKIVDFLKGTDINVCLVGEEFLKLNQERYKVFKSTKEVNDYLASINFASALVLIKGSRGIGLERCLESIKEL